MIREDFDHLPPLRASLSRAVVGLLGAGSGKLVVTTEAVDRLRSQRDQHERRHEVRDLVVERRRLEEIGQKPGGVQQKTTRKNAISFGKRAVPATGYAPARAVR